MSEPSVVPALADRSHAELVVLVPELLLAGHLIDRAGMPSLLAHVSTDVMAEVAIEEWMGASPLYTRRMQKLLGFEGTDVATIFKGMQLDIGAPPQFMDFRYEVADEAHGEFKLAHCGALMDVEPMGDEMVVAMCHHIEDPTFPATACATNPRAVMAPVHRPPRSSATPVHEHCHWTVVIDPLTDPAPEPTEAVRLSATLAASLPLPVIGPPGDGDPADARADYSGPLEADVPFAEFSSSALVAMAEEAAVQGHLLQLSFFASAADRLGPDVAADLARTQLTGVGAVVAERLALALGVPVGGAPIGDATASAGCSLTDVASVLAVHPAFLPAAYVDLRLNLSSVGDSLVVILGDCPALHELVALSWPAALLGADPDAPGPLDAIVQALDPHLRVVSVAPVGDAVASWEIVRVDEPAPEPDAVLLTRFSTGATFRFTPR